MKPKIDRTRRGGDCHDPKCYCRNTSEGIRFWDSHPDSMKRDDCYKSLCPCKIRISDWPESLQVG